MNLRNLRDSSKEFRRLASEFLLLCPLASREDVLDIIYPSGISDKHRVPELNFVLIRGPYGLRGVGLDYFAWERVVIANPKKRIVLVPKIGGSTRAIAEVYIGDDGTLVAQRY